MVRTWAVWRHRNRYIGRGLSVVWIGTVVSSCFFLVVYVRSAIRTWLIISICSTLDNDFRSTCRTLWRISRVSQYRTPQIVFSIWHETSLHWVVLCRIPWVCVILWFQVVCLPLVSDAGSDGYQCIQILFVVTALVEWFLILTLFDPQTSTNSWDSSRISYIETVRYLYVLWTEAIHWIASIGILYYVYLLGMFF
jgi:hypothetical protein